MAKESKEAIKILFCGDAQVGKTTIINWYQKKEFSQNEYEPTITTQFFQNNVKLSSGKEVNCHFWDTSGTDNYRSIVPMYFRGAKGAFVVCAADVPESFDSIPEWINDIKKVVDDCEIYLLYNKDDLNNEEMKNMFITFAESNNYNYGVTSALKGEGITIAVQNLCQTIIDKEGGDQDETMERTLNLEKTKEKKRFC